MASKFNKPKDVKAAPSAAKPTLDDELGFSSSLCSPYPEVSSRLSGNDEVASSDTESASSSGEEGAQTQKSEPPGFFILQHRNAQDNILVLTEQKLKVYR